MNNKQSDKQKKQKSKQTHQSNNQRQSAKIFRLYLDDYHQQQLPVINSSSIQDQQVIEVVSFDINQQSRIQDLSVILKSFKEIQDRQRVNELNRQVSKQYLSFLKDDPDQYNLSMIAMAKDKRISEDLASVVNKIQLLKDSNMHHKQYLMDKVKLWKRQFLKIQEFINNVLVQNSHKEQQMSQIETLYKQLNKSGKEKSQQFLKQIQLLKNSIQHQKESNRRLRIQKNEEMMKNQQLLKEKQHDESIIKQLKQKLLGHSKEIKKYKDQNIKFSTTRQSTQKFHQSLQSQRKSKANKTNEFQLTQMKQSFKSLNERYLKLKSRMKQKQLRQQQLQNKLNQYSKKIKEFKQKLQSKQSSKYPQKDIDIRQERQKLTSQIKKLRDLLKISEEQLIECQMYIQKYSTDIHQLESQKQQLVNELKENEFYYKNKLNLLINSLNQCQNNIKGMSANIYYKQEKIKNQEASLHKRQKYLEEKSQEVFKKEVEIEQMKYEYEKQLQNIILREQAMKAQYKMAINMQNITKDKWYEKYYSIFSPQKHITRDHNRGSVINAPKLHRVQQNRAIKEVASDRKLSRVKSEAYERRYTTIEHKKGLIKFQSQKNLFNLQNRINSLKHELKQQLGNIKPK